MCHTPNLYKSESWSQVLFAWILPHFYFCYSLIEGSHSNSQTYLCQRARPAVVSSLEFHTSCVSGGSPFPKTVLLRLSKNCCVYSSSFFRSAAACAPFKILPEPRKVEGVDGAAGRASEVVGCLGAAVRFLDTVSRDGIFATGGPILMGFLADFGGSLKLKSGRGQPSVHM
jgi:hypothetical protein